MSSSRFKANEKYRIPLERLKSRCADLTDQDLINTAITLLEKCVDELEEGRKLASIDEKRKRYRIIEIPAFSTLVTQKASRA